MFGEIPLCDGGGFSEETQQEIADAMMKQSRKRGRGGAWVYAFVNV